MEKNHFEKIIVSRIAQRVHILDGWLHLNCRGYKNANRSEAGMDWTALFARFLEAKRMFPDPRSRQATYVSQNVYGLYEEVLMAALKIVELIKDLTNNSRPTFE